MEVESVASCASLIDLIIGRELKKALPEESEDIALNLELDSSDPSFICWDKGNLYRCQMQEIYTQECLNILQSKCAPHRLLGYSSPPLDSLAQPLRDEPRPCVGPCNMPTETFSSFRLKLLDSAEERR